MGCLSPEHVVLGAMKKQTEAKEHAIKQHASNRPVPAYASRIMPRTPALSSWMTDYKPSSSHCFWSFFFSHSNRHNLTKMEELPRETAEGIHDRGHFCCLSGYFTATDGGLQSLKLLSRCKVSSSHDSHPQQRTQWYNVL